MTETFSPNETVEQDLSETKIRNGYCFLQKIDALPNHLKLGMDVELCLRKTHKEESERPEEVANNLFPPRVVHVIVKDDRNNVDQVEIRNLIQHTFTYFSTSASTSELT